MKRNVKIEVYESPVSDNIIASFYNSKNFKIWLNAHIDSLSADCVVINDCVMYGWDEIELTLDIRLTFN